MFPHQKTPHANAPLRAPSLRSTRTTGAVDVCQQNPMRRDINTPPHILVIDDEPMVAASVRQAVPGWHVDEEHDGAAGIARIRALHDQLDLVVLDVSMPRHDGILVCVQARMAFPDLRILPFTGGEQHLEALIGLRCLPPLLKPIGLDDLATALHQALGMDSPPLPYTPLVQYVHAHAIQSERQVALDSCPLQIAILASATNMQKLLHDDIAATGGAVRVQSTHVGHLRNQLVPMRVSALVADHYIAHAAVDLAQSMHLPLLVIAFSLSEAYRQPETVTGVVVNPAGVGLLAEALAQVQSGVQFRDPILTKPLTTLTCAERPVAQLILRGESTDSIATELCLAKQTIRSYRSNIYQKLGVNGIESFRAYVDSFQFQYAREVGAN